MSRAAGWPGRHAIQSAAVLLAAAGMSGLAFGSAGLFLAGVISTLWLAWRFNNDTGTFLVLAVLLLIACGVLAMILALMAVVF